MYIYLGVDVGIYPRQVYTTGSLRYIRVMIPCLETTRYLSSGFLPNSDIGARDPISVYPDVGSDIGALFWTRSSNVGVPVISEYSGYRIT